MPITKKSVRRYDGLKEKEHNLKIFNKEVEKGHDLALKTINATSRYIENESNYWVQVSMIITVIYLGLMQYLNSTNNLIISTLVFIVVLIAINLIIYKKRKGLKDISDMYQKMLKKYSDRLKRIQKEFGLY